MTSIILPAPEDPSEEHHLLGNALAKTTAAAQGQGITEVTEAGGLALWE